MFVIEFGVNHLGNSKYLKSLINFYINSSFKMVTLMAHSEEYYFQHPNHRLSYNDYEKIIDICANKGKKIGLSVCDKKTFEPLSELKFNFYKLLSIANNDKDLIDLVKRKNKHVYISTGFSDDKRVAKSLKYFFNFKKKTLLHTPMTYKSEELNFKKISYFKKKFNQTVGYSNHNNNSKTLFALSAYDPKIIFLYAKPKVNLRKKFPDNDHAFKIDQLESIKKNYIECLNSHKINNKINKKIVIFK
jgi:sialic acid synthase SpsE